MTSNIQDISLDIYDSHTYEQIFSKQYDNGRKVRFTITENGQEYDLTDKTVSFEIKKDDGTVVLKSCQIEGNQAIVTIDKNITVFFGNRIPYQIKIVDVINQAVITTVTGYMFIQESVVKQDDVESTNDFSSYADILLEISTKYEQSKTFADNAKQSETNAKKSETNASASASTATAKATEASESATNAKTSETNAKTSETNVKTSETNAKKSETNAKTSETNASISETNATTSATTATTKATEASNSASNAKEYAIGSTNSSKYYYEQAKQISESFSGALKPMGTITYSALTKLTQISPGDMYNVSDQFTTTDQFKEGAGNIIPAGSNVYRTSDNKWDVLAGTPVTGVKGAKESTYRRGNVDITAEHIGALTVDGDAGDTTVTYTSNDSTTAQDATPPAVMTSGEKLSSLFSKLSTFGKNVRWLLSRMGSTDISTIGDGTITGALTTLNSNLTPIRIETPLTIPDKVSIMKEYRYKIGNLASVTVFLMTNELNTRHTISGFPPCFPYASMTPHVKSRCNTAFIDENGILTFQADEPTGIWLSCVYIIKDSISIT